MGRISFTNRHIITIKDFTRAEVDYLIKTAERVGSKPQMFSKLLENRLLGLLFFEPSTRTRLSFEAAMKRLGGRVLGFTGTAGTAVEKGETLADTLRVVENYVDAIVLRHPLEGSARMAADLASIPIINAGTGGEEHPTQALLDLYTIYKEAGRISGLNIGLLGDLRYGRTVHSLAYALSLYNVHLYLISPEPLRMRKEVITSIKGKTKLFETAHLEDVLDELDVLYVTRIQKERFPDPGEYEKVRGAYRVNLEHLKDAKEDLIIMHPLPRVEEIDPEIDKTRHAVYFKQVKYGVLTRMALLALVFGAIK